MTSVVTAGVSFDRPANALPALLEAALSARSQLGWSRWLQGEIQSFLPHDALIAAWGVFPAGELAYDVITRTPALALDVLAKDIIEPLMGTLYARWLAAGQEPVAIDTRALRSVGNDLFSFSPCALVHGVQDHRSRYDCIYVFVGPSSLDSPFSRQLCRMVLPYIDMAFRQLSDRGHKEAEEDPSEASLFSSSFADCTFAQASAQGDIEVATRREPAWGDGAAGERGCALSARELEVMKWVRMGKTNSEIAIILNLSMFTVKNHMRRIYRKLDVLNRAQAVGSLDRVYGTAQDARR